jgi:hypothetical protein
MGYQFVSWIYPLGPYLSGGKNFDNPPDIATFVIRSFSLNHDKTFKATEVNRAINHVSIGF